MSNKNIIRAWKDKDYFDSLSAEERSRLPENPAGVIIEMSDEDMESITGGDKKRQRQGRRLRRLRKAVNTFKCQIVSYYCKIEGNSYAC